MRIVTWLATLLAVGGGSTTGVDAAEALATPPRCTSLLVTVGDTTIRLDGPKSWTLSRIEYQGSRLGIEESAYGTVVNFQGLGFVGSGHHENESEKVDALQVSLDGEILASPLLDKPEVELRGRRFSLQKSSRIRNLSCESLVELDGGRLHETVTLRAAEATPLEKLYHFMHAWTPDATHYLAGRPDQGEIRGQFSNAPEFDRKFHVEQEVDWVAVYVASTGKGAVSRLTQRPAAGGAKCLLWNVPDVYRKFYLQCFAQESIPAGFVGTYRLSTAFFSADEAHWEARARELAAELDRGPNDGNPRTVYISTGDNQDLLWLPFDSHASVSAAFEAMKRNYRAERIWWRGGQDEVWANEFELRPENRLYAETWDWWRDLAYREVGTNRIAVRTAHDLGQEIWMAYGLFDNGSQPDVGFSGFPYAAEDRLRVEHPEWAPVNRFGTARQGGPIEFCYPEARRAMVQYLSRHLIAGGYDGIGLMTYVENYSLRYDEEFGYNDPIVDEFRRRHGVDIRREPFDQQAWARLRGEYLTEFLRELRAALAPHGKRVAICVDGEDPHTPCRWNGIPGHVRTAGKIQFDLETWAKEQVVDEIMIWGPQTEDAIATGLAACRGTGTQLSVFRTRGPLPRGVPRMMFLGTDVESGFDWENYIDFPDEQIPTLPSHDLLARDPFARRRLLTAVNKGRQEAPLGELIAATRDPDLYVRRAALRALAAKKDAAAVPAVRAALADNENSVRCTAAVALVEVAGLAAIDTLLDEVDSDLATHQFRRRAVPEAIKKLATNEGTVAVEERLKLAREFSSTSARRRLASLLILAQLGAPATPEVEAALHAILRDSADPYERELALVHLRSSFGPTATVLRAVRATMQDKDQVVQLRAAVVLARLARSMEQAARDQAMEEVERFFARYGTPAAGAPRRPDAAWGWRELGNAMLEWGEEGEHRLTRLMKGEDRKVAELAWRVLFLRQSDRYDRVTAEQDAAAHTLFPK